MILSNLDELLPYNPVIIIKTLKLINILAFKNSMDVRRQMKQLKMFELRDQLLILHLRNVSEILLALNGESENEEMPLSNEAKKFLLKSVSDFSYDVVAAKTKFKEALGTEIVALTLLNFV
jgi:hypothetical protein